MILGLAVTCSTPWPSTKWEVVAVLLPVAARMAPAMLLHIAYHCLIAIVVGIHVYSLSAHSAIIPDLPVLLSLDQDFNKLLDRLFAPQRINALLSLFILLPDGLNGPLYKRITEEDLAQWRAAWKSDVRVVVGKEGVEVIAISELARKYKTTVSQVILSIQQQGYIMLGWDQYQNLLDEIGSLIGRDEESLPGAIVGIPVTTTDSPQGK